MYIHIHDEIFIATGMRSSSASFVSLFLLSADPHSYKYVVSSRGLLCGGRKNWEKDVRVGWSWITSARMTFGM